MSQAKRNGPIPKRAEPARGDSDQQQECTRLREQVKQLTKERDGLKRLVKLLQSKDNAYFYSIVRLVRDEMTKGKTWDPANEKGWTDLGELVEELEHEFRK
jgi:hypothetical protein